MTRKRQMLTAAAVVGLQAALLWALIPHLLPAQEPQAGPIPRPIVDTHELMELFNEPLYKRLQAAVQDKSSGELDYATLRERGLQTAEVANLVALRKDRSEWRRLAGNVQQAGIELAQTAKSQDAEATVRAYRSVVSSCNACHQKMAPDHAPQLKP